jgi:hypothetical protein
MYQTEIQFFWPLTEQIPLDLNYTNCDKPKLTTLYTPYGNNTVFGFHTWGNNINNTFTANQFVFDVQSTTIRHKTKPPLYRRLMYRLMGLKWDTK